jgi:hypothetical protein
VTGTGSPASGSLDQWLQDRQVMTSLIQQHAHRASARMKQQADKGRTERSFQVGDRVFLKLQPYIQSSLAPRANKNLAYKYFGPFTVLRKIGKAAYKLELPVTSLIHPVFHVSQFKRMTKEPITPSIELPGELSKLQVPEAVLNQRLSTRGVHLVQQVLVRWSNSPDTLATWEDLEPLKQRFPEAPAWGQAGSYGGEVVRTPALSGAPVADQEAGRSGTKSEALGRKASSRKRQPNKLVSGPQWTV